MRYGLLCAAILAAVAMGARSASAQLLYSFESPAVNPDGFGPNGGGVTITQDTIGATQGTHSMNMSVVTGATFVGALTSTVAPPLDSPPIAPESILFDYNLPTAFPGAFAVVGVTVFGFNAPLGQFGLQAQFAGLLHLEGQSPGQHFNAQIDLTGATNPLTFAANQSYNQIFVSGTPDASHLTPSGFEFFLNKSNDAPVTVYIDNVRMAPEPASLMLGGLALGGLSLKRRR